MKDFSDNPYQSPECSEIYVQKESLCSSSKIDDGAIESIEYEKWY